MTSSSDNAASVRSTISRKKLAANRRNARKSTGPRSDEGKRVSSRNALTHAIFCRDLLVEGESAEQLAELRVGIDAALDPQDEIERGFVDSIIAARWQLRRLRAAGRHVHGDAVAHAREWGTEKLGVLEAQIELECQIERPGPERAAVRAHREPRRARYEAAATGPMPIERTLAQDLANADSAWERLSRYEQRLEQNIARSMRELRLHRKELREFGRPEPIDDDNGKAQNEPTEAEPVASDDTAEGCDVSSCGLGVPPELHANEQSSGETPKPQWGEESCQNHTRGASD